MNTLKNMTVLELIPSDVPLHLAVEDAVETVSESVKEFSEATIARVKAQSNERGAAFQARCATMFVRMKHFSEEMIRLSEADRDLVGKQVLESVSPWIDDFDDVLKTFDEAVLLTNMASRETRRKHADWFKRLKNGITDVEKMRAIVIDLLEYFDPTPDDYLEQELRQIYGDAAEDLLKGFEEISSSDSFRAEAFKQRHGLK